MLKLYVYIKQNAAFYNVAVFKILNGWSYEVLVIRFSESQLSYTQEPIIDIANTSGKS